MSVTTLINQIKYNGNGSTTIFAYTFRIFNQGDLTVVVDGVTKIITTDYTVSGVGDATGGNVTFVVAPPAGTRNVVITREMVIEQTVDLAEASKFPIDSVEELFDRDTMQIQQVDEIIGRSIRAARDHSAASWDGEIPDPGLPANQDKGIFTKPDGTGIVLKTVASTDIANPLTAKGEILTHDGTVIVVLVPGANNLPIVADSGVTEGLAYKVLPVAGGGSAAVTLTGILKGNGTSPFTALAIPLIVANGGIGVATLTDGGPLVGKGTNPVAALVRPTNGQLMIGSTGLNPVIAALTAGIGIGVVNAAGAITINSTNESVVKAVATAEVALSTSATNIISFSVPANTMGTNGAFFVRAYGKYHTSNQAAQILTIDIQLGGTVILSMPADLIVTTAAAEGAWYFEGIVSSDNSATAQKEWAYFQAGNAGSGEGTSPAGVGTHDTIRDTSAIDTTSTLTLNVRGTEGSTNVVAVVDYAILEFRKP